MKTLYVLNIICQYLITIMTIMVCSWIIGFIIALAWQTFDLQAPKMPRWRGRTA